MKDMINIEKISKKHCRTLKKSMMYGAQDIIREMVNMSPSFVNLRDDEFWAVKDISLNLEAGDSLAIVGPNGSGKSTLLKMVNGIVLPDRGRIKLKGRVGALIEVGAGFTLCYRVGKMYM